MGTVDELLLNQDAVIEIHDCRVKSDDLQSMSFKERTDLSVQLVDSPLFDDKGGGRTKEVQG